MSHIDRKGRPNNVVVINMVGGDSEQSYPNDHKSDMPKCAHGTSPQDAERNAQEKNEQGGYDADCYG